MKVRRRILSIVTPIVLAPLALLWVALFMTLTPVLRQAEALREGIQELENVSAVARREARLRFETATREAYAFGLANIGANIDGQLDAIEKALLVTSLREDLVALLGDGDGAEPSSDVAAYFQNLAQAHDLATISLVDREGRVVLRVRRVGAVSGGDDEQSPSYETTRGPSLTPFGQWYQRRVSFSGPTSWDVFRIDLGDGRGAIPVVSAAVAVGPLAPGPALGYLQLAIPVDRLAEVIRGPDELTSSLRLVGRDGEEYWREAGASEDRDQDEEQLQISQLIRGGALNAEVRLPQSVVFSNLEPYDALSDSIAARLQWMDEENLALESMVDRTERMAWVAALALAVGALALLFLLLGGVSRRIERLSRITERIRDGDWEADLPKFEQEDELAALSGSIDDMRLRIRTHIGRLDREVESRTQELNEANARLEVEIEERRKAEEAALAASQAKGDFLATMSHEIRTPLNGVFGGMNLLMHSELTEEQRTFGEVVQNSTQTLKALLDDILDLSKIEAGKLVFEEAPFDLSRALREVSSGFRLSAEEKGLSFRYEEKLGDSVYRRGDATRLKQVVANLLSNAIKFTKEGSVTLSVERSPVEEKEICIKVEDTGIGMSPEQVPRVFETFTQADSSIARKFGGTGLGLAISSRLAEQMGGGLEASSEKGSGSRFTLRVSLPFAMDRVESAREERVGKGGAASQAQGSILFADDDPSNRLVVSRMLELAGFQVTAVADGETCAQKALEEDYDLVLMDFSMPLMDGCEASRQIRAGETEGRRRVAIVGLTAHASEAVRQQCMDSGMDDVLFKPLPSEILVDGCLRAMQESAKA